jgi:cytochrome c oxidase subunit IV
MLWWCAFLFVLGILAFMDTIFNYGEIFRKINSVVFMMTALGLLMRVSMKTKIKTIEGYIMKIQQLEKQVAELMSRSNEYTEKVDTHR